MLYLVGIWGFIAWGLLYSYKKVKEVINPIGLNCFDIFCAQLTDEWIDKIVLMISNKIALICLLHKASLPTLHSVSSPCWVPWSISLICSFLLFSHGPPPSSRVSLFLEAYAKSPNQAPFASFFCLTSEDAFLFMSQMTSTKLGLRDIQIYSHLTSETCWRQLWDVERLVLSLWALLALSLLHWHCNWGSSNMASRLTGFKKMQKRDLLFQCFLFKREEPHSTPFPQVECMSPWL